MLGSLTLVFYWIYGAVLTLQLSLKQLYIAQQRSMADIRKVVLLGASGVLGSAILQALRAGDGFEVTVTSRPDSKTSFPDDVTVFKTMYEFDDLVRVFRGQDAVVCATGLAAISHQKAIVDACVTTGVHRYITNDFGNAPEFQGLPELEFTRKPKQAILDYVQQQAEAHQTLTWTALATGHFLDYAIKKFPAFGFNITERSARLVDGGDEPFSATTLPDIGAAVAGILTHPAETANKYLLVRSIETTQNEILHAFEEQTGVKWTVTHKSSHDLYESGKVKMSQGGGRDAILELLPVQIFEKGARRSTFPRERYDNGLVGLPEQSVEQVVRDVLATE